MPEFQSPTQKPSPHCVYHPELVEMKYKTREAQSTGVYPPVKCARNPVALVFTTGKTVIASG